MPRTLVSFPWCKHRGSNSPLRWLKIFPWMLRRADGGGCPQRPSRPPSWIGLVRWWLQVGSAEPRSGFLPQSHTRSLPDTLTSGICPTRHECFTYPQSHNMQSVATPFTILHPDSAVSTFSRRTLYQAHFSAGPKCYCYLQSDQAAEGLYKQPRMKIHLPWTVYSFSRKRRAVCRGRPRFSGGNQCPSTGTQHIGVLQGDGWATALDLWDFSHSILLGCPGLLRGPDNQPHAQAAPLESADKLWGRESQHPQGYLHPPPGRVGFYRDIESVFW